MQTTIDYKEEGQLYAIIIGIGILILFVIGEPFIELWNMTNLFIIENITKIRFFVYLGNTLSVLFLFVLLILVYVRFGKLKAILFFIFLHYLDLMITGNNTLLEFIFKGLKNIFSWLFGTV